MKLFFKKKIENPIEETKVVKSAKEAHVIADDSQPERKRRQKEMEDDELNFALLHISDCAKLGEYSITIWLSKYTPNVPFRLRSLGFRCIEGDKSEQMSQQYKITW